MGTKRSSRRFWLGEELIVEILSRLPVKSLMRFSCVSKTWYSLTRNSYLINIHLRRSDSNLSLIPYYRVYRDLRYNNVPKAGIAMLGDEGADGLVSMDLSIPKSKSGKIVGSSNGLVCLVTYYKFRRRKFMDDGLEIIVRNPATKQFRALPKPIPVKVSYRYDYPTFGFGFCDDNADDYKVVGFFNRRVQVFTRSTNCWREVEGKGLPPSFRVRYSVWLKGVLYWSAIHRPIPLPTDKIVGQFILSFNLRDEVFHVIQFPSWDVRNSRLLRWKDRVACIIGSNQVWAAKTDESEGNNYKTVWAEQFSIIEYFPLPGYDKLLGIWNDQVLISRHMPSYGGLFLYDPATKQRGKLLRQPEDQNKYYSYNESAVNYVESLALV